MTHCSYEQRSSNKAENIKMKLFTCNIKDKVTDATIARHAYTIQ